ncbi:hypothetical protein INT44_002424 [Umbelopsis vinacea]|uniref:Uncharacterized protein n=1 Tax=Umbelopsis vinacea TaxID=44442 RepID=A0A8H7UH63_9FUNG|nr:hypothetical protein INT44_002424 [Umbelopsis vinacea]
MSAPRLDNGTIGKENGNTVEVVETDDFNLGKLMQDLNGAESMLTSIESRAAELDAKLDALLQEATTASAEPDTSSA